MEDRRRILTTLSVTTLASFLTGFNARLAVVGYPIILKALGADVWKMAWIIQGYMLGSTIVQLIIGTLADVRGRVRLFSLGTLIFSLGSLLSGFSVNPVMLILARVVQGIGGAFMMSLSVAILTDNVPSKSLATWLGVNQTAWRAGALIGLSVSGFLIEHLGWRSIFLIQVPLGVATYFWIKVRLKEAYTPSSAERVDVIRLILVTLMITVLLISLTLYGYGYLSLSRNFLGVWAFLTIALLIKELPGWGGPRGSELIKSRTFIVSLLTQFIYAIGFGATALLFSLLLEVVNGLSPTATGILLVPFEASFLVFGLLGGKLSDIYGRELLSSLGLMISSISLIAASKPEVAGSVHYLVFAQVVYGVGAGLFVAPNTSLIMASAPPGRRGIASSLRSLSFNVGFLISLNIAILSMTSLIPYDVATKLIGGIKSFGAYQMSDLQLAICRALRDLGAAMLGAFLISMMRVPTSRSDKRRAGL